MATFNLVGNNPTLSAKIKEILKPVTTDSLERVIHYYGYRFKMILKNGKNVFVDYHKYDSDGETFKIFVSHHSTKPNDDDFIIESKEDLDKYKDILNHDVFNNLINLKYTFDDLVNNW